MDRRLIGLGAMVMVGTGALLASATQGFDDADDVSGTGCGSTLSGIVAAIEKACADDEPPAAMAADEENDDDNGTVEINLADAPEPVRAAATKFAAAEFIKRVVKSEIDDGLYVYSVDFTDGDADCTAVVSSAGETIELTRGLNADALPKATLEAIMREHPGAAVKGAKLVQRFYYELVVTVDGEEQTVLADAAGNLEDAEPADAGCGDEVAPEEDPEQMAVSADGTGPA